ncbi:MAG: phosphoglycolate phosphatase [Candidimonas sp.]|jgi:phosphoglycolate phosphatase
MRYHAVLLDLDGTLLDTIPDLTEAVNAMLADMDHEPLPMAQIASYVGKGAHVLIQRVLRAALPDRSDDPHVREQAMQSWRRHYHRVNGSGARPYAGTREGLDAFRRSGAKLGVVTNKPGEFTLPLLRRSGLAPYFDVVVCGDTCAEKKPHPMPVLHACAQLATPPGKALFIGDSINDAQAARAAGLDVLAVPYGYNEGKDVRELDVDAIVTSIELAAQWAARP